MKLYELPPGSNFKIVDGLRVPPEAPPVDTETTYRLMNIDGAYSYCVAQDGTIVHVLAYAEVIEA